MNPDFNRLYRWSLGVAANCAKTVQIYMGPKGTLNRVTIWVKTFAYYDVHHFKTVFKLGMKRFVSISL